MSLIERLIVRAASNILPTKPALRFGLALLGTQGFGWAGGVATSGEIPFIRRVLSGLASPVIFDVGGNVGSYTCQCLAANQSAQVHVFEPSLRHSEIISEVVKPYGRERVCLNRFGLSDREETLSLYKDAEVTGLASLNQRDLAHIGTQMNLEESVVVKVGDEYVAAAIPENRIQLLKIDVEGWEMPVLKGFLRTLKARKIRCVQFEFGHAHIERRENFRDFYRLFRDLSYSIGVMRPNGTVWFMDRYLEVAENYYATNYVATCDELLLKHLT